jgi:hypothetical protein
MRDRVAHGRLLDIRRHQAYIREFTGHLAEGVEARAVDAVVVGDENAHSGNIRGDGEDDADLQPLRGR